MTTIRLIPFFASVLIGLSLLVPMASQASESFQLASVQPLGSPSNEDIPLVIIRFNQKRMYYDRQLYKAVSKAVSLKPSVIFDIVSFVPSTRSRELNERHARQASSQTSGVINSLLKMGVPRKNIRMSREKASDIRHHEVHVYVE